MIGNRTAAVASAGTTFPAVDDRQQDRGRCKPRPWMIGTTFPPSMIGTTFPPSIDTAGTAGTTGTTAAVATRGPG